MIQVILILRASRRCQWDCRNKTDMSNSIHKLCRWYCNTFEFRRTTSHVLICMVRFDDIIMPGIYLFIMVIMMSIILLKKYFSKSVDMTNVTLSCSKVMISCHWDQQESTHQMFSIEKDLLKNFAKFTGERLCQTLTDSNQALNCKEILRKF